MELRLLGTLTLSRDGSSIPLPASRKTRALLGFLAATGKSERRERLCQLFWELPDDPKGALRWSLSKIRTLVDEGALNRLTADRDAVRLDCDTVQMDWRDMRSAAAGELTLIQTNRLEALAAIEGEFLEGLDLPRCDGFQAWLIAQREDVRKARVAILAELTRRDLPPDSALAYARRWTEVDPFDGDAHVALNRLLEAAGRHGEALKQREIGIRRLNEGDFHIPSGLRASTGRAGEDRQEDRGEEDALPIQHVRFCTASDGTGLAWSTVGDGPPLVKAANWLNHLEYDWDSPIWRHWLVALIRDRTLLRYDERGNGLSDWNADDISFEAMVDDMESVIDAAGLDRFDLLGVSQGSSISIAYAVRHPERVRRLILYGGYAAGWRVRANAEEIARREAMKTLTLQGWGQNNPAYRQMFTTLFLPDATPPQMDWFNELQRMTASPANAVRLQDAFAEINVRPLLPQVRTPALVLHAREDAVIPFASGRELASSIPGARFVPLESRNHLLLANEPAWDRFLSSVTEFLND